MITEYNLFIELCRRTKTNSLTPEDTLTLLRHPEWIDQIAIWNHRDVFLKTIQNQPIILPHL